MFRVSRTAHEFLFLKKYIEAMRPFSILIPVSSIMDYLKDLDRGFIPKGYLLNFFLQEILLHPILSKDEHISSFFTAETFKVTCLFI
jgi:hypothetical protein